MNKMLSMILFLIYNSSVLIATNQNNHNNDPFAQLLAVRKQMKIDERVYRQACYNAYRKEKNPPKRIPSPAQVDEELLIEQCKLKLKKTHIKELFKARLRSVIKGGLITGTIGLVACGCCVPSRRMLEVLFWIGTTSVPGGLLGFEMSDYENTVLTQELSKRKGHAEDTSVRPPL